MSCRTIFSGPGILAIECGPRAEAKKCHTPGCSGRATTACQFAVRRRDPKASTTCDAHLCDACRREQGDGRGFCPPHDRLATNRARAS